MKTKSQWIKAVNVKPDTTKLLAENIWETGKILAQRLPGRDPRSTNEITSNEEASVL